MSQLQAELGLKTNTVVLDVRPVLAVGKEPFHEIMAAVEALAPGQGLAVRAPFEPRPLFGLLAARGFQSQSRKLAADDWLVEFLPVAVDAAPTAETAAPAATVPAAYQTLDVRGLEPPEPLVRILALCQALAPGATLKVLHERRPSLLYPRLEALGLLHRTEELADDLYHIFITRPGTEAH